MYRLKTKLTHWTTKSRMKKMKQIKKPNKPKRWKFERKVKRCGLINLGSSLPIYLIRDSIGSEAEKKTKEIIKQKNCSWVEKRQESSE